MSELFSFGYWLRRQRLARDLRQAELAQRLAVAVITLRKLEADERRPSLQLLERLAAEFELEAAERLLLLRAARCDLGAALLPLWLPSHPLEAAPASRLLGDAQPADVPAPRHARALRQNLPNPPNPLIGREVELATIGALLRSDTVRLVTLTGPGGVGKTRVALQVAAAALGMFPDGIWFVDLAPLHDPDLVLVSIAQTLGVREASRSVHARLADYLREKRLLLLLDNCEHLLAAGSELAALLAAAPGLKALATSRAALHLAGEHEYAISPLSLPEPGATQVAEQLTQSEAVRLFVVRAQAVRAEFALTSANGPAIAAICQRLDGMPLAIELAAARVRLYAPEALLARLDGRLQDGALQFLVGGPRDMPVRQQTLRSTIDWSYDLLAPAEQRLFARLGGFSGGWDLEAAEAVCGPTLDADVAAVLEVLVQQSLVRVSGGPAGEPRFGMLETIREYSLERLAVSGGAEEVWRAHAAHYLALAEAAALMLPSGQRPTWLERLAAEYDNLRAVLAWSRTVMDGGQLQLRLVAALWLFWHFRGYANEGSGWLEEVLERTNASEATPARAWACCGAGALAWQQGNHAIARAWLEESAATFRMLRDRRGLAYALTHLGLVLEHQSDLAAARVVQEESVALFRALGDRWGLALATGYLAEVPYFQHDYATARALLEEAVALFRMEGDHWGIGRALAVLAMVAHAQGDDVAARPLFEESLPLLRATGDTFSLAATLNVQGNMWRCLSDYEQATACYEASIAMFRELGNRGLIIGPLHNLGFVALHRGDSTRAATYFVESLIFAQMQSDQGEIAACFIGLAGVAGTSGEFERATRLFAAADMLLIRNSDSLDPANRSEYDRSMAAAQAQLDEATFAAAWAEGRGLTLKQAIAEALAPS